MANDDKARRLRQRLADLGLDITTLDVDSIEVELPTLRYGYATEPLTWDRLHHIIIVEGDLAKLSRSAEQQKEYEIFRTCLKRQFSSVLDFILITKFGFERSLEGGSQLWKADPQLENYSSVRKILVRNDFPYCTAKGIVHYVLWKTKDRVSKEDIENAKVELNEKMNLKETLHWINPPHLKSLPEIDHAHILCRVGHD